MKVKGLKLEKLEIPFKISFKHASASRSKTESILIILEAKGGQKGYGEGCPRSYFTGETLKTAVEFFEKNRPSLQKVTSLADLKLWILDNQQ